MINQYETVFIATPVLSEAQMKEAVEKYRKIITDAGGKIIHEENWGLKKLAYPIQKKSTGFYYLIEFQCEGQFIQKLETEYRRDERIIRFLTFKMDKYSVAYAEKKRAQSKESGNIKPEKASEEKPNKKETEDVKATEETDKTETQGEEDNAEEAVSNEDAEVNNENTEE